MSDKVSSPQMGLSIRLMRHWSPEPIHEELRRDAETLVRWCGRIYSEPRDRFFQALNMPGAQE